MSETALFGKVKDPKLTVLNFRGQLQCRMWGKREGLMKAFPKFWNLNPVARNSREVTRIPAWMKGFEFMKKQLETILEREVLAAVIPEFLTVRRMTLGMNSPMEVRRYKRDRQWNGNRKRSWTVGIPFSSDTQPRCISTLVRSRQTHGLLKEKICGV